MTDSKKDNPYSPPASEIGSRPDPNTIKSSTNIWTLFVIPFFLAHMVYWPIFVIAGFLGTPSGPHAALGGAIFGLMVASPAVVVAGFCYGFWLGRKVRAERVNNATQPTMLYATGQAVWFAFSVFAPCGLFLFGGG